MEIPDYLPLAGFAADANPSYLDAFPLPGENYYAVSTINSAGEGAWSPILQIFSGADSDGDGLIDINTLEDLNNIRHNLLGTSYKTSASDPGNTTGCPEDGCHGYELMRDLDFANPESYAGDSINQAWRPEGGDPVLAANQGWVPIAVVDGRKFQRQIRRKWLYNSKSL